MNVLSYMHGVSHFIYIRFSCRILVSGRKHIGISIFKCQEFLANSKLSNPHILKVDSTRACTLVKAYYFVGKAKPT